MTDLSKVRPSHTARHAFIYIRQSSASQVEHNRESTARQYALADRAQQLGWTKDGIVLIDDDLGLSGASTNNRSGFARMISETALGNVGMILGLEVSRLARNNADWYRLLELCGLTDTLIADADGVYHPALFNDRLLLGLKGTMSEAELHILRARLDGGIRNKAARGELRRGLPVGLGRLRRRSLVSSRRSGHNCDSFRLRSLCRIRLRTPCLAVAAFGRSEVPLAGWSARADSLGRPHLHCNP